MKIKIYNKNGMASQVVYKRVMGSIPPPSDKLNVRQVLQTTVQYCTNIGTYSFFTNKKTKCFRTRACMNVLPNNKSKNVDKNTPHHFKHNIPD